MPYLIKWDDLILFSENEKSRTLQLVSVLPLADDSCFKAPEL